MAEDIYIFGEKIDEYWIESVSKEEILKLINHLSTELTATRKRFDSYVEMQGVLNKKKEKETKNDKA